MSHTHKKITPASKAPAKHVHTTASGEHIHLACLNRKRTFSTRGHGHHGHRGVSTIILVILFMIMLMTMLHMFGLVRSEGGSENSLNHTGMYLQ